MVGCLKYVQFTACQLYLKKLFTKKSHWEPFSGGSFHPRHSTKTSPNRDTMASFLPTRWFWICLNLLNLSLALGLIEHLFFLEMCSFLDFLPAHSLGFFPPSHWFLLFSLLCWPQCFSQTLLARGPLAVVFSLLFLSIYTFLQAYLNEPCDSKRCHLRCPIEFSEMMEIFCSPGVYYGGH